MTAISIDNPVKNAVSPEPKYFDGLPVTGKQRRIVFLLAFGFFFDFMDNSNFGVVAPAILKLWHLSLQQIGWINSAFFIGMFIGGISGGHLSNVFGRKKVLLASIAFFSVFSLFNGLAPGFITFLLARLLTGIGTASLVVVTNLYLIEMLPGESRGRWQALVFALGVLGIPILGLLNKIIIPSGPEAWRVLYFLGGAGFLAFFAGLIWLRESPRWLVSKGRIAEAELILGDITGLDIRLNPSTSVPEKAFGLVYTIRSLTGQANLRRTIVLTSIFWVGYPAYAILGWLPTLFSKKGFSLDETASFSICLALGLTAASFVASLISDLGGRKWSIITLFLSAGILSLLYGHLESKYLIFGFVILFSLVVQALNPITSTYLAELYPTPIRGLAVGLIYSIGRIAIAFVQLLIAPISERFGDVGVFTFTAVLFAVPAAITALWGERTSGRSLENLAS
ncbi:MFS transporter [Mucilaginibacter paludis]|uniref:Major facilitator superfamily MFS_1 n=1 Tax=Mucilaginibacter paludis DSM 18603 TaxID=714943 RepID=H1Y5B0_9SPHI|nr:MFS transporter [Mucilaginibacter paludis]EHQ28921.1 major facilitator superfamily MFS_1 [Mucilaginibacter paludis DSM 18603]